MLAITVRTDRKPDVRIPVPEIRVMYVVFDASLGPNGRFCCMWRPDDTSRGGYVSHTSFAVCREFADRLGYDNLFYYGPVSLLYPFHYTTLKGAH